MSPFFSSLLGPFSNMFGGKKSSDKIDGYSKVPTMPGNVQTIINQILSNSPNQNQLSQKGFESFLPGGTGNNPIIDKANQNFQQKTLPQILNSFGSDVGFGDSSLNQALAAGASNLNTNIADIMAKNQLSAAKGLGDLSTQNFSSGINKDQFAYLEDQQGFGQEAMLQLVKILPQLIPFLI